VVQLSQPQVLRFAIDDLYTGVTAEKLGRYALIVLAIAAAAGLLRFGMRHLVIGISRRLEFDLRNELFAHLQKMPVQWFQRRRTGEIMSIATNDMAAVRMMLGPGVMYTVNTLTVGILSVSFMPRSAPPALICAAAAAARLTVGRGGSATIHPPVRARAEKMAQLSARVRENLAGLRVVRAFGAGPASWGFENPVRGYRQGHLPDPHLGRVQPSLAFWAARRAAHDLIGGREVVAGHITLGQFVAFTVLGIAQLADGGAPGWVISIFQRGSASHRRITELLSEPPAVESAPDALRPARPARGELEFRDLTFRYPGSTEPVLTRVSLHVPAGSTVALVGRTASGKSTLLSLPARVFDPPPGTVFVDGHDVRTLDLAWLRAQVASVPQDPFLFSATVAENIAYGVPGEDRPAIERAAAVAHLTPDVRGFPDGLDTLVGERGITLSGGQRQRTAIARAVLRDAPILLDGFLSSVDTQTEEEILSQLRGEMRRRTTLIVSHRVSTVRDADHILVLEHGAVVERGRHAELLALGGHYAALHRAQQLEEEIAAS
jgi:ATP-binding cassette subfamily B protein